MNSLILRNGSHTFRAWRNPYLDPLSFKIKLTRAGRSEVFRTRRERYTSAYVLRMADTWERAYDARRAYLADRNAAQDELYREWDDYRRAQSDGLAI